MSTQVISRVFRFNFERMFQERMQFLFDIPEKILQK